MKKTRVIVLSIIFLFSFGTKVISQDTKIDHSIWNDLLSTFVDQEGMVDYEGFQKSRSKLESYTNILVENVPSDSWEDSEKLAYWINAYNAFTVSLILDHYPLKSIMDIDKAWDFKFIKLGEEVYSLNQIEHEIIRKDFDEPRIHFVLVCAAVSCPILLNQAYLPNTLEEQFQKQGEVFINDPSRNKVSEKKVQLSQLFNWYKDDFTKQGSLIEYLNHFSKTAINPKASVGFLEYDWGLNGQ